MRRLRGLQSLNSSPIMSDARPALQQVVVAGGGQVGILTAIAVRRALPGCEVIVLGLPADPAAFADFAATALPFTNKLHDRLGIGEAEIVARAGGSHRLVTRYFGWGEAGQQGVMHYGAAIDPALKTGFSRDWGGGGQHNLTGERAAGSVSEVLADSGRFCVPPDDFDSPLVELDYCLRWNPAAYRSLLVAAAQKLGIAHLQANSLLVKPDSVGGIAALTIDGQQQLEADLYIDCSGPQAGLLTALPGHSVSSWEKALPVRKLLVAKPGQPMLALEDRISLLPEGWLTEVAGRDGLQVSLGIAEGVSQQAALAALALEPLAQLPVDPGRADATWLGNVIAIGDAAARFEPLGFLNLDLAHRQIALLVEMLPGQTIEPLERKEYNRRVDLMLDRVRDTLAAHYATPRAQEIFGAVQTQPQVEFALDQFQRRGRIAFWEEAPFLSQELMALLSAIGFEEGIAPQSRATDESKILAARQMFEAQARAAMEFAPPYAEWMGAVLQQASPANSG